jgi:DNA-damage-inducible protein D
MAKKNGNSGIVPMAGDSPFDRIRRTNASGNDHWSSRDLARILEYTNYRNFGLVIQKARLACFNSGHRVDDHFVDVDEMVPIGSGAQRPITTTLLSRYACYLVIQNADPGKPHVAMGQTYFAVLEGQNPGSTKADGTEIMRTTKMGNDHG